MMPRATCPCCKRKKRRTGATVACFAHQRVVDRPVCCGDDARFRFASEADERLARSIFRVARGASRNSIHTGA